jgi:5-methylthioribose kinase
LIPLSPATAPAYLQSRGLPSPDNVCELGGGVSNTVLLVETAGCRIVLKQALAKLRVEQDWFSDPRRIFRESAAIARLAPVFPHGSLPEILFEDHENFAFAMTAAPPEAETWKARLMRGEVDPAIAARIGEMLSAMVNATWHSPTWERTFGDRTVFDELRLDPYYRATAARHPDLAAHFDRLIERRALSLVHGDWSPKNFLVAGDAVMAIDFEVIHFGDPAFDSCFLLNHLVLKAFYNPHCRDRYRTAAIRFQHALGDWATLAHLGALMLARVDGKSPAEYLQPDLRPRVRAFARDLILRPPASIEEVFDRL